MLSLCLSCAQNDALLVSLNGKDVQDFRSLPVYGRKANRRLESINKVGLRVRESGLGLCANYVSKQVTGLSNSTTVMLGTEAVPQLSKAVLSCGIGVLGLPRIVKTPLSTQLITWYRSTGVT